MTEEQKEGWVGIVAGIFLFVFGMVAGGLSRDGEVKELREDRMKELQTRLQCAADLEAETARAAAAVSSAQWSRHNYDVCRARFITCNAGFDKCMWP